MASMRWLLLLMRGGKRMPCRVGKGAGRVFPHDASSRAPCPPWTVQLASMPLVGTAHERLYDSEMSCQRLCPPYKNALLRRLGIVVEIKITDLVVDRARVPHAALRIDEELAHGNFRMRVRILDHLAGLGIEAAERVLLVRGVPDHVIAIDADRVRARLRARQWEFLEGLGLGIEAADPVAAPLAEPDDAVVVDLDALRLALGGRKELRQHAVLDARDRAVVTE